MTCKSWRAAPRNQSWWLRMVPVCLSDASMSSNSVTETEKSACSVCLALGCSKWNDSGRLAGRELLPPDTRYAEDFSDGA